MPSAAFFDLDKTILAKSSSLMFAKPFYDGGLIGRADVLRSAYAQFVYLISGADHDQMEQMRACAYCRYGAVLPSNESIRSQSKM